jgi:hypothetical protein
MSSFTIDFFELSFLAEACIPPRPIARTMFWQNLTNVYWEQMTENERGRLFSWLQLNMMYEESLKEEEDTQIFHARFDPSNQYEVTYEYDGQKGKQRAFLFRERYWTSTRKYISPEYILHINQLILPDEQ